jgi:hypothetical protein
MAQLDGDVVAQLDGDVVAQLDGDVVAQLTGCGGSVRGMWWLSWLRQLGGTIQRMQSLSKNNFLKIFKLKCVGGILF